MEKKYEILKDKHATFQYAPENRVRCHDVYQIRALINIPQRGVRAGDLGGYIESEANLSHEGFCWVQNGAVVCDHASVSQNALISGSAIVTDSAHVSGWALVAGRSIISGSAKVTDDAVVSGEVEMTSDAVVSGYGRVKGKCRLGKGAIINSFWGNCDYITIGPIGSRKDITTFYMTKDGIWVCCGCFNDSIKEFCAAVRKKHGNSKFTTDYMAAVIMAKNILGDNVYDT